MKQYLATFYGRRVGAIGRMYKIQDIVTANDEKSAELALYDKYEHISDLWLHHDGMPDIIGPCVLID